VKERPILFSGPMVRAIVEDRKTQTRRAVKSWPPQVILPSEVRGDFIFAATIAPAGAYEPTINPYGAVSVTAWNGEKLGVKPGEFFWDCPYGRLGDRLWVRETWGEDSVTGWSEFHRREMDADFLVFRADGERKGVRWRPSIHMPRANSRITLEITGVRVERLQEISEQDAKAEGADPMKNQGEYAYRGGFEELWDSINGPRGLGWVANPWVWVLEFRRVN
jgi:hypothetical protein